jgi:uncharacterized protein YegP (UPF0339 family)
MRSRLSRSFRRSSAEIMPETNVQKIEIYKAPDGLRWRAVAKNGEIVASGEAYTTMQHVLDATWAIFPNVTSEREYVGEEA